ncbi:Ku protein [Aquabacter sp. CN5-332]|uniref:Ku protein n=1 Tax=Aquabacter sp. CN5-332 TaxID=3156608 RepID=UPI0032B5A641
MAGRSKASARPASSRRNKGPTRSAFWKGFLKLSLVTCPVTMTPATTESGKVRFHTINRETGHRVRASYYDPDTDEPVDEDDLRRL